MNAVTAMVISINPGQPLVHIGSPTKNASGFPIKQWYNSRESPPRYVEPLSFDPAESVSSIGMNIRAAFTTPLYSYQPQTPYSLS